MEKCNEAKSIHTKSKFTVMCKLKAAVLNLATEHADNYFSTFNNFAIFLVDYAVPQIQHNINICLCWHLDVILLQCEYIDTLRTHAP